MQFNSYVRDGHICVPGNVDLAEGTSVVVRVDRRPAIEEYDGPKRPLSHPLVRSTGSGPISITNADLEQDWIDDHIGDHESDPATG